MQLQSIKVILKQAKDKFLDAMESQLIPGLTFITNEFVATLNTSLLFRGLLQLVSAGNYRSAVNMTAQLLEMYGQV